MSPINARKRLAAFIHTAKKDLQIYDPNISDTNMAKALVARAAAGVRVRVIGKMSRKSAHIDVRRLTGLRLHTRTIICDGRAAFVGSQSLRALELDERRELGVIVRGARTVKRLVDTFEADWSAKELSANPEATARDLKIAVKAAAAELTPLNPIVRQAVTDVVEKTGSEDLDPKEVQERIQKAVKEAVRERVQEIMNEAGDA
jgi:phosphatidylserine/phosphatidylglycerophosphate/cardiolipin synthase-like enzyme